MKNKKNIFIFIGIVIVIIGIVATIFYFLTDKNKLTVTERNWINNNINTVQNINVLNNVNIFGKDGSGVFYNFLADFEKEYDLKMNPITYNKGNTPSGLNLGMKNNLTDSDVVFYIDHYVLVGSKDEVITDINELVGRRIGVLNSDLSYISSYFPNTSGISLTQYESIDALYNSLNQDIDLMIIPLLENLDSILNKNYHVLYHFSDMKIYFTLQTDNSTLGNILRKYYNKWQNNFEQYFNQAEFTTFTSSLGISETEIDSIQSVEYNYGFVNTSPYEVIMGGEYGGIVAVYLSHFSDFANVEFNFNKYRTIEKFQDAINNEDIDLYFNYYNFTNKYNTTNGLPISYVIASLRDNTKAMLSANSLANETVFVQENSLIYDYIKNVKNIKIKTYNDLKDLKKQTKKMANHDYYIVMDKNIFEYNQNNELKDYTVKYIDNIKNEYQFKVRTNSALYKLLDKYIEVLDPKVITNEGLNNHYETVKSGSILSSIAEYIIYFVLIAIIVALLIIRKSKKIIIAKKIKKDDKLKFIDQLTSLKNRNFLNENISVWNNNTIYPQTIIVLDLNKIQEINDVEGYNEGDKQIKACANILIKTQLDNSEIMRTDGNEFVIYLVGYSQKQITNYLHKLSKEIKKLPYEYGAEFGYSMIVDDIKTIEDAMNEAVDDMKKQKSDGSEKQTKK